MAASFWSRLARWWPSSAQAAPGARQTRPCLEQLGDRTLLSVSTLNPVVRLADDTAKNPWGATTGQVSYGLGTAADPDSTAAKLSHLFQAMMRVNPMATPDSDAEYQD